jgi:hypothetical protein
MKATLKIAGASQIEARLDRRLEPALQKVLKEQAAELSTYMHDRFSVGRNGANTDDSPFAPLAESTLENIADKAGGGKKGAKRVANHRTLIGDGRMFNSLYAVVNGFKITVGSDVEYLMYHVFGTKHMPRRSVVPILLKGGKVTEETRGSGAKWWTGFRVAIGGVLKWQSAPRT